VEFSSLLQSQKIDFLQVSFNQQYRGGAKKRFEILAGINFESGSAGAFKCPIKMVNKNLAVCKEVDRIDPETESKYVQIVSFQIFGYDTIQMNTGYAINEKSTESSTSVRKTFTYTVVYDKDGNPEETEPKLAEMGEFFYERTIPYRAVAKGNGIIAFQRDQEELFYQFISKKHSFDQTSNFFLYPARGSARPTLLRAYPSWASVVIQAGGKLHQHRTSSRALSLAVDTLVYREPTLTIPYVQRQADGSAVVRSVTLATAATDLRTTLQSIADSAASAPVPAVGGYPLRLRLSAALGLPQVAVLGPGGQVLNEERRTRHFRLEVNGARSEIRGNVFSQGDVAVNFDTKEILRCKQYNWVSKSSEKHCVSDRYFNIEVGEVIKPPKFYRDHLIAFSIKSKVVSILVLFFEESFESFSTELYEGAVENAMVDAALIPFRSLGVAKLVTLAANSSAAAAFESQARRPVAQPRVFTGLGLVHGVSVQADSDLGLAVAGSRASLTGAADFNNGPRLAPLAAADGLALAALVLDRERQLVCMTLTNGTEIQSDLKNNNLINFAFGFPKSSNFCNKKSQIEFENTNIEIWLESHIHKDQSFKLNLKNSFTKRSGFSIDNLISLKLQTEKIFNHNNKPEIWVLENSLKDFVFIEREADIRGHILSMNLINKPQQSNSKLVPKIFRCSDFELIVSANKVMDIQVIDKSLFMVYMDNQKLTINTIFTTSSGIMISLQEFLVNINDGIPEIATPLTITPLDYETFVLSVGIRLKYSEIEYTNYSLLFDKAKKTLIKKKEERGIFQSISFINRVHCASIIFTDCKNMTVGMVLGKKELWFELITTKNSQANIEKISVDFNEMHYYDKVKCYMRDESLVECLFVGRKIKIVRFVINGMTASVKGKPEEYYAYKNIDPEDVDFNNYSILVSGSRYANNDEVDTFDHSGVFIYNRLTSEGGSPYVRHLISKDEIFEFTRSNRIRAVLRDNQILVHGGTTNTIAVYNISQYKLEGKEL
jgi:hypothetical protein